jgi:hypothetical protein
MIVPLEIRLLGPFEVLVAGRPASVSGSKAEVPRLVGCHATGDPGWRVGGFEGVPTAASSL